MRYFHRTSVSPDEVLAQADRHFGARMEMIGVEQRSRVFQSPLGRIEISVEAEGGHYTLVTVSTDQVGESEADKVAKRFLTLVHKSADPVHKVRGAY